MESTRRVGLQGTTMSVLCSTSFNVTAITYCLHEALLTYHSRTWERKRSQIETENPVNIQPITVKQVSGGRKSESKVYGYANRRECVQKSKLH